jgi:hypothetical protein
MGIWAEKEVNLAKKEGRNDAFATWITTQAKIAA